MTELQTKYVFMDTSTFISNNFQFHAHALGSFKELCRKGIFSLLMNSVVEREVKAHLIKKAQEAEREIKTYQDKLRVLRNLPELPQHNIFKVLPKGQIEKLLLEKFEKFKEEAASQNICESAVSIPTILDKYFNAAPPFSDKKKSEFPDAISAISLLNWAEKSNEKIYLLSTDPDMRAFCEESSGKLIFIDKLDVFLDMVLNTEEGSKYISSFAMKAYDALYDQIKHAVHDELVNIEALSQDWEIENTIDHWNIRDIEIAKPRMYSATKNKASFSIPISFNIYATHIDNKNCFGTSPKTVRLKHQVHKSANLGIEFKNGIQDSAKIQYLYIYDCKIELPRETGIEVTKDNT